MVIRPMLAAHFEDEELLDLPAALAKHINFPVLASPKIDGIRFLVVDGQAQSRSGKPLPNRQFQEFIYDHRHELESCDGEVVTGLDPACTDTSNGTLFNRTQSHIMSRDALGDFSLHFFDKFAQPDFPFRFRTHSASSHVLALKHPKVHYVKHTILNSPEEVVQYEEAALLAGYEGIMLRNPFASYKYGRSTLKQQGLVKIKRFVDDEAVVVGFVPLARNTNPIVLDAFGLAKRSSHQAGKVADELLGKLIVKHSKYGEFCVGSGFDMNTREIVWNRKEDYLGRIVTFKYQPHGTMNAPRAPIFKGFRSRDDV